MPAELLKNVSVTSGNNSAQFQINVAPALLVIEQASGLTAKMQLLNPSSTNWVDITDNLGTLKTFTGNGTYDLSGLPQLTQYRIAVTAGSGYFTALA